jgi:hypothetical protein
VLPGTCDAEVSEKLLTMRGRLDIVVIEAYRSLSGRCMREIPNKATGKTPHHTDFLILEDL